MMIMQQTMKQQVMQRPLAFKTAVCDPESYKAFIDQLIYGERMRDVIMCPIPFQVG